MDGRGGAGVGKAQHTHPDGNHHKQSNEEADYRRRTPDSRVPSSSAASTNRSPLINTPGNVPPYMLPYAAGGLIPPFSLYSATSQASTPLSTPANSHMYRGGSNLTPEVS